MELAAAPLLLATASSAGGCFANVTVAGIVPAEPDFLFRLFGPDYTKSGHGLFSDVRACREVGRSALRLSRAQHLTQEVDVEQVARVSVLRMPVDAPMTVKLDCNHTLRQVRLRLVKGNMLMRRMEGLYAFVPWDAAAPHPPALPEGLADALGPEAWQQLTAKLAAMAPPPPPQQQAKGAAGSGALRPRQRRRPQHSLVILHQKLQPGVRPPPGLGGFVRGQVRRQFEGMFRELHRACQSVTPARPSLHCLGDWLRSFPIGDLGL